MDSDLTLASVASAEDILPAYRNTEVEDLLTGHCLGRPIETSGGATSLILTCMDPRIILNLPSGFAFVVRTAGATSEPVLSNIAFAVTMAGVTSIVVMGHTDCAMTKLDQSSGAFRQTLEAQESIPSADAQALATSIDETFRVDDPVASTWQAARHLKALFPTCIVAPLLYRVEDHSIHQIVEKAAD